MKKVLTLTLILLAAIASQAQTAGSYGELRAKVLHVKERYAGQDTGSDQAAAVVLHKLCKDYQHRLTLSQCRELAGYIQSMRQQTVSDRQRQLLAEACRLLRQKSDTLDFQQRILDYYRKVPQEIIYVQTDKPYYVAGDTVWFRAHLVDAVTHTPISRSRYVYVELLDNTSDSLVQRVIVKCDSAGVFANALLLPKSLHGGSYTLAAYTQWMRNFPVSRFFYKMLTVVGSAPQGDSQFPPRRQPFPSKETPLFPQGNRMLQIAQRKGQLLIQFNEGGGEPLSCVLYGSGNLIVTDYTQGKVLYIDSQSLRPGSISIAMVNRETGGVIAESQTLIEAGSAQVTICGQARSNNEPMELTIDMADADGTPLRGSFSLSVTDYDVVKPDTVQPAIDRYLAQQQGDYLLADMLSSNYPHIDYNFQTSQTISGQIQGTIFKNVRHPKLMLVRPDTGLRETFELGDSSRFTINGLDFADGTTYLLEGLRRTGSNRLVKLTVTPPTYPTLHPTAVTQYPSSAVPPSEFLAQAQKQVMYGSDDYIQLPEVIKEKKRRHKPMNRMNIEPFRGLYDDSPLLNNYPTIETMLSSLGLKISRDDGGYQLHPVSNAKIGPLIYIDDFESNVEELLMLQPSNLMSVEYLKHGYPQLLTYRWDAPTQGVLLVTHKPGHRFSRGKPLSMATITHQGWKPAVEFYSPQYPDKSSKTRPDQRTTLYWEPKLTTDAGGHATVRFYASDVSKRYLVTLEGVSDDGIIIRKQTIIE